MRNQNLLRLCCMVGVLLGTVLSSDVSAEGSFLGRRQHPWGRFEKGSWREIRITNQKVDENGQIVTSGTVHIKATLIDISDESFTLRIERKVSFAGKDFDSPPEDVTRGFLNQAKTEQVSIAPLDEKEIEIDGKVYKCKGERIKITGEKVSRVIDQYLLQGTAPYLMQTKLTVTDVESKAVTEKTTEAVISLNMPYRFGGEVITASFVLKNKELRDTSTVTREVHSHQVPGQIVSFSQKEFDKEGRLIRRSTLELTDYEIISKKKGRRRPGLGARKKTRRENRRTRRN